MAVKKKRKVSVKKRKVSVKKRRAPAKKKRLARAKKRKSNPIVQFFTPFVVQNGDKYYYGGINFKTKGLKFYENSYQGIKYNARNDATVELKTLVTVFLRDTKLAKTVGAISVSVNVKK